MDDQIFTDRAEALKQINQWIREGSNLESWYSHGLSDWVVLRGRDGVEERFYIFYSEEAKQAFLNNALATD